MSLSVEDLMKDRYKVIADYLFSPYKIGDIIKPIDINHRSVHLANIPYKEMGENRIQECFYDIDDCVLYPALFQPLPWYAERSVEQMPEYLMYNDKTSSVYGVHPVSWEEIKRGYVTADFGVSPIHNSHWMLLTEQEYLAYQSKTT